VDELPLITKDRYALRIGGRNLSHYTWRDLRTDRGADSLRWESPDRGGRLVRQLAFHEDGFELRVRLTLKPELKGKLSFGYELSLDPEFVYGADDWPGGTLVAMVGESRVRRELRLPPLLSLREEGHQPLGVTDCRALELRWQGSTQRRQLAIEILDGESWRGAFYDNRLTTLAYLLRISRVGEPMEGRRIEFAVRFRLE